MTEFDKKLIELWFKEYIHEPTWFKAWSKQDLCIVDDWCKDWFLV